MVTLMRVMPAPGEDTASAYLEEVQFERMLYAETDWLQSRTPIRRRLADGTFSSGRRRPKAHRMPPARPRFVVAGKAVMVDRITSLQTPPLLTHEEKTLLEELPVTEMPLLLYTWMLRAVRQSIEILSEDRGESDASYMEDKAALEALYLEMQTPIRELYDACVKITQELALPVPLPYFHAVRPGAHSEPCIASTHYRC